MRSKHWLLAVCAVALLVLLSACSEQSHDGKLDKLLISEIYTGATAGGTQWVELYNNTDDEINLAGWKLVTTKGEVALNGKMAAKPADPTKAQPRRFVVTSNTASLIDQAYTAQVDAAIPVDQLKVNKLPPIFFQEDKTLMGKLDPKNEIILLKKGNEIIDQVGWGTVSDADKNRLGVVNTKNLEETAPDGNDRTLGRTPNGAVASGGPAGLFTVHNNPSPGIGVPKPTSRYNTFLGPVTDILTGIGGLILWLVFILIALIARRFQVLAEQKTYWEWLMAAPIGIAIYDAVVVYNYVTEGNLTAALPSWVAFGALFLSGLACLYVINIFRLVAKNILESE